MKLGQLETIARGLFAFFEAIFEGTVETISIISNSDFFSDQFRVPAHQAVITGQVLGVAVGTLPHVFEISAVHHRILLGKTRRASHIRFQPHRFLSLFDPAVCPFLAMQWPNRFVMVVLLNEVGELSAGDAESVRSLSVLLVI